MFHRVFLPIVLLLIALATLSCGQGSTDNRSDSDGVGGFSPAAEIKVADFPIDEYFDDEWQSSDDSVAPPFALSEGQLDWDAGEARPPLAQVTALTQEQVQSLLNRLPPFHALEGDVEQARLPDELLPPPRPGTEVELPFPPPQAVTKAVTKPNDYADTPLAVLRYSPDGDVPLAPQLSVTFNQPMVPLSSHQELSQEDVPVKLSPAVPGHWRWVGTKTLLFEAEVDGVDRMPMATEYTVEIPAGTEVGERPGIGGNRQLVLPHTGPHFADGTSHTIGSLWVGAGPLCIIQSAHRSSPT